MTISIDKIESQLDNLNDLIGTLAEPSSIFKPTLFKNPDGSWVATYGALSGRGVSPQEAMDDFNGRFYSYL